jgi:hypothetical protein
MSWKIISVSLRTKAYSVNTTNFDVIVKLVSKHEIRENATSITELISKSGLSDSFSSEAFGELFLNATTDPRAGVHVLRQGTIWQA